MIKLFTNLLLLLYYFTSTGQVTFNQIPRDLQLYPRDAKSQAEVSINGIVTNSGYTKISMQVLRASALTKTISQTFASTSNQTPFQLTSVIKAEPAEYSFRVFLHKGPDSTLIAERKRIVCGDVYILYGQSNALAKAGLDTTYASNFDDTYLRTCAFPTDSTYVPSELAWYPAKRPSGAVGGLGLTLQRLIFQTYGIPTCVLNGALGGANINDLLYRDANNHANPGNAYGRLLYRAQWANVAKQSKGIIWRQGEAEAGSSTAGYEKHFTTLYNQLREDYGDVRIYVAQINILANAQDASAALRDFQRRNKYLFKNIETIATVGTPGYDGTHYSPKGYQQLAFEQFRQIARDVYGSTDTIQINSPDIKKVFYNSRKDTITMVFDEGMQMVWQNDTTIYNAKTGAKIVTRYQKDNYALEGNPWWVTTGYADGNRIVVSLLAPARARKIRYLPPYFLPDSLSGYFEGTTLRNSRGMRAFSFDEVPIADALTPVTTLAAKALSDKQIQLSWVAPLADQNQIVERADGTPQNFKKIASLSSSAASYVDTNLPDPFGPYYYRIRLFNNLSESPPGNVAIAKPLVLGLEPTELAIKLFPIPLASDRLLHIEADQITFTEMFLYDLRGRIVKSWHGKTKEKLSVFLDDLEASQYVAEIHTLGGGIFRQKITVH